MTYQIEPDFTAYLPPTGSQAAVDSATLQKIQRYGYPVRPAFNTCKASPAGR